MHSIGQHERLLVAREEGGTSQNEVPDRISEVADLDRSGTSVFGREIPRHASNSFFETLVMFCLRIQLLKLATH